ncbi:Trichocyst matrix protein T1-B [Paramecium bursaria]
MKAFILACVVLSAFAIDVNHQIWTKHEQQSLAQIASSGWGSWILNFSELHLQSEGALGDLLQAIEQLLDELSTELLEVHAKYRRRTDQHNRDVTRLEQEIQDIEREIFNAHDFIDNVLIPQGERFANQLEQLRANIENNRKSLTEETFQREQAHREFEDRAAEHTAAIEAIDESLQLLAQLKNPSLAQIQKVQSNLVKIENHLKKHSVFTPLVRALIELATEAGFADQGALSQILTAFADLRAQLVNSLNTETADENDAQKTFVARVAQLNGEHSEFQRAVVIKTAEIDANQAKLEYTEELLDQKIQDLATLNGQLQAENDDFAYETDLYNSLVAEYNKEIDASTKAYALLTQPSFKEYVAARGGL